MSIRSKNFAVTATILAVIGIALFIALSGGSTDAPSSNATVDAGSTSSSQNKQHSPLSDAGTGSYVSYEDFQSNATTYSDKKKVLFFAASWCPTCRQLDGDISSSLSDIPADTVIVKVDYDNSDDLKRKHGVTYQHTLVQIDDNGNQIKKWHHSSSLDRLIEELNS